MLYLLPYKLHIRNKCFSMYNPWLCEKEIKKLIEKLNGLLSEHVMILTIFCVDIWNVKMIFHFRIFKFCRSSKSVLDLLTVNRFQAEHI